MKPKKKVTAWSLSHFGSGNWTLFVHYGNEVKSVNASTLIRLIIATVGGWLR